MEVIPVPPRAVTLREPANPYYSIGAWIFLGMIFMAGTLFGLWLPRLCQRGHQVGGSLKTLAQKVWAKAKEVGCIIQCWASANSTMNRSLLRGGTPKRGTHTNTEQMSPPWCSSTETDEHEGTLKREHKEVQSHRNSSGPSRPASSTREEGTNTHHPEGTETGKPRFRKTMEAMITAASPRK